MTRVPRRRVSDVIPDQNLWPELPRRDLHEVAGVDLIIDGVGFLTGDTGPFAVMKLAEATSPDDWFTSACGGAVVVRKLQAINEGGDFPILGRFTEEASQKRKGKFYWNLT